MTYCVAAPQRGMPCYFSILHTALGHVADFPTGTLTFLFTDIEGSTHLWEVQRAEMQTALARHDVLLRHAVTAHRGHVFKTGGDAFCAAFPTASDAIAAALDAQRSLRVEPWPAPLRLSVRMALHTGAAELRDADYFGEPLNRVARLLAAGHGEQTLVSEATSDLCLHAARLALENSGIAAEDLDMIIVGTITPDYQFPSTACVLQNKLGLSPGKIGAFDLSAACSGFGYGLATAQASANRSPSGIGDVVSPRAVR